MRLFFFYFGKTLELIGLMCMPTALYYGFVLPGSQGMAYEMGVLGIGVLIFGLGRVIEGIGGKAS